MKRALATIVPQSPQCFEIAAAAYKADPVGGEFRAARGLVDSGLLDSGWAQVGELVFIECDLHHADTSNRCVWSICSSPPCPGRQPCLHPKLWRRRGAFCDGFLRPANAEGTTMGSCIAAAAWPEERPGLPGTSATVSEPRLADPDHRRTSAPSARKIKIRSSSEQP
jgi:hypothetical protein